jgi:hypothetical protein
MGNPQEILVGAITRNSNAHDTAVSLTAAAGVYGSYTVHYPVMLRRFSLAISTAVSDLTSSIVSLSKVSVANVTTEVTTITVPNGTAAGKVMVKDFTPVKVGIGDKIELKRKTQGGLGGTPAGAGFFGFLATLHPEYYGNETNATTSA